MDWQTTVLLIACILSLPGVLFLSFWSSTRTVKLLGLLGAVIGAIIGAYVTYAYVTSLSKQDGVSLLVGGFLACSLLGFTCSFFLRFLWNILRRSTAAQPSLAAHNGAH